MALEDNVLRLVHEEYDHVGIEKRLGQNQKIYWFPNKRSKINKFSRNYLKCIYYSSPNVENERNLQSIKKKPIF